MRAILTLLLIMGFAASAQSADIHFFNTDVLGRSTSESVSLLEKNDTDNKTQIEPKIVHLDIENNIYTASSVYYPAEAINFKQLIEQIEKRYQVTKHIGENGGGFAAYRIESEQFAINLSSDLEEDMYRVIYLKFR